MNHRSIIEGENTLSTSNYNKNIKQTIIMIRYSLGVDQNRLSKQNKIQKCKNQTIMDKNKINKLTREQKNLFISVPFETAKVG